MPAKARLDSISDWDSFPNYEDQAEAASLRPGSFKDLAAS